MTTANISDKAGAMGLPESRNADFQKVSTVPVNGGYSGQPFADFVRATLDAGMELAKRNELHAFAVIPKLWVVERSISRLEKCRRIRKNCERKLSTSLSMIRLAFISLLLRRL